MILDHVASSDWSAIYIDEVLHYKTSHAIPSSVWKEIEYIPISEERRWFVEWENRELMPTTDFCDIELLLKRAER